MPLKCSCDSPDYHDLARKVRSKELGELVGSPPLSFKPEPRRGRRPGPQKKRKGESNGKG